MIAIVGAMEEEIVHLNAEIEQPQNIACGDFTVIKGTWHGHQVVLMQSGVGKVYAAIRLSELIRTMKPNIVINIGTAGGLHPDVQPLDVIVANGVVYHDVDITGFSSNYAYGQVAGGAPRIFRPDAKLISVIEQLPGQENLLHGIILSGDSFISNRAKMELIVGQNFAKDFPIAVDMESGAIAQTCYYYHLPFLVLRAVSDKVGAENQHMDFTTFVRESSKKSTALLGQLLRRLNPSDYI